MRGLQIHYIPSAVTCDHLGRMLGRDNLSHNYIPHGPTCVNAFVGSGPQKHKPTSNKRRFEYKYDEFHSFAKSYGIRRNTHQALYASL